MFPYCFTRRAADGFDHLEFSLDGPASVLGLSADGAGKRYLALNVTDPLRRLPRYGIVCLPPEGDPYGWEVPKPVYLPDLFRREDGSVWILGTVESGNREAEVLLPVEAREVPASRRRFPASEETLLSTRGGALIRFLRDTWRKAPARIVTDTLGAKGKRSEWKLPKEPYPSRAWLDPDGLIHVLSLAPPESRHSIYTASGARVAEHPVAFGGVGGRGGYQPLEMRTDGCNRFVSGHLGGLGIVTTHPEGESDYTELLTLAGDQFVYALWAPVSLPGGGWAARFTFGSQSTGAGGNGWLAVRGDQLVGSWLREGPGEYRDLHGGRHPLDAETLTLTDLAALPDGRLACSFERQDQNKPGRIHVALVTLA